jgi:hypothetical protein
MPRRNDEGKEGHGEPKGVRLTARTNSEGANPKDGARMEKAWQVTAVGAKRSQNERETRNVKRAQAEQAAFNRKHVNPGR